MSLLPPSTLDTGYLAGLRRLRVSNGSGEVIPPHALMRATGNDADGLLVVDKPDGNSLTHLLVNGPLPIAADATGLATFDEPVPVAYDDAHTPAVGDTWGSASGSWLLTHGQTGWRVMGDPDTEATTVEAARQVGGVPSCGGLCGSAPALPATACLRFSAASGWATCLPATLPLRLEAVGTDGCGWRYVAAAGGAMAADCLGSPVVVAVCGRPTAVAVTLTCDAGDWKLVYTGSDAAGVTGGRPLDGTLTSAAVTSATFAADGSLSLGTITIGGSSAVTIELAWGSECLDCGCDGPPGLLADACLLVDDKTGTATCAPEVVTLALAAGGRYAPSGGSLVSAVECSGDVGGGNGGTATVCGQETFLGVAVTCAVGGGYLVTYTGVGYAGAPPADGNPLAGGIQVVVPCDTFDAAFGTVDLGTLTTTGGSVRLLLAWGDSCSVPPGDCPPPCDLTLTYDWDDGLGDTGTGTLTVPFTEYTGGLATWEGTFTTRCGTSFVWTITCDAEGDTALVVYDGVTPVLEATFAESAGVWTGTITTACGDLTAVSFEADCSPPPPPPTCPPWCDAVVRYDYAVGGYTGSSGFSIPFDTYDSGTQTTTWAGSASTPCGLLWVVITCDDAGAVSLIGYDSGGTAVFEVTFTQAAPNEWTGTIVTDCGGAFTAVTLLAGCSPGGGGGVLTPGGIVAGGVV